MFASKSSYARAVSTLRQAGRRLRSGVGGLLPERARYLVWERAVPKLGLARALGHRLPEPVDLACLELIGAWPDDELRDPVALEERLWSLGVNEEIAHVLPAARREATGQGLRFTQFPSQFAPYLVAVGRLGVRSYLEIGVDHGGTFLITTTYLSRLGPLERATAVDRFEIPALRERDAPARVTDVLRADSTSRQVTEYVAEHGPFDLVLIDGDHSEEGVRRDLELVRRHARAIALHDIVGANTPGVRAAWQWIRRDLAGEYELHEFTAQYPETAAALDGGKALGIGLAVRRTPGSPTTDGRG
jgi:Methyltransferase domain